LSKSYGSYGSGSGSTTLFIGQRDRSLDYQCLACMPRIVDIKAHVTSLNNLKLHMLKHHPELSDQFHYVIKQCSGRGKGKNRWAKALFSYFGKSSGHIGFALICPCRICIAKTDSCR
jgi:hypothetical protein